MINQKIQQSEIIPGFPGNRAKVRELFLQQGSFGGNDNLNELIMKLSEYYLANIIEDSKRRKWLEPLTVFSMDKMPIYEDIPRGRVHELGLPHGASDALIYCVESNRYLVTTRKDDGKLDSLGGHKASGLNFTENMVKEILEELYSNDINEFSLTEQKRFLDTDLLAQEIGRRIKPKNLTINENIINRQTNIHVSQLFVFEITNELFDLRKLDSASLSKVEWYTFDEIQVKMRTDEARDGFKIVWKNYLNEIF